MVTPKPPSPLLHVKTEPEDASINPLVKKPDFFKSMEQLNALASSITQFNNKLLELRDHFDSIDSAITQHEQQQNHSDTDSKPTNLTTAAVTVAENQTTENKDEKKSKSEVMRLCELMCGRSLRRYITSNLSNISKLEAEIPQALKCAPKPAKLVLECVGGFYLQGSKAFANNSPMIPGRKASILALEFFLLSLGDNNSADIDSGSKREAEQVAVAWRRRLIAEGGVRKAGEADAKGLLLLIGCFGIPKVFSNGDVWDLIKLSNAKKFSSSLRKSRVLVNLVSDILEGMVKNGVKIEALDVAYTFGIEERFPPQRLLTSLLQDSEETLKRREREANNSPALLKEATRKHLAILKSTVKFLEDKRLEPKEILPGWEFRESIDKLEKDIAELNKKIDDGKMTQKRKGNVNESSNNLKIQEAKRLRFTGSAVSPPRFGLHEQTVPGHVDGTGLYNTSMRINMLDGGFSAHINHPAASMLYGSGSYSTLYRETFGGRTGEMMGSNSSIYGLVDAGESSIIDGTRRQGFSHQSGSGLFSPSIEGFVGLPNSSPAGATNRTSGSDLYRFADAVK